MTSGTEPLPDAAARRGAGPWWGGLVVLLVGGYLAFRRAQPDHRRVRW